MHWHKAQDKAGIPYRALRSLRQTVVLTGGRWPVGRGRPLPPQACWTQIPLPEAWGLLRGADWAPSAPSKAPGPEGVGMTTAQEAGGPGPGGRSLTDSRTRADAHLRASRPGPLTQGFFAWFCAFLATVPVRVTVGDKLYPQAEGLERLLKEQSEGQGVGHHEGSAPTSRPKGTRVQGNHKSQKESRVDRAPDSEGSHSLPGLSVPSRTREPTEKRG